MRSSAAAATLLLLVASPPLAPKAPVADTASARPDAAAPAQPGLTSIESQRPSPETLTRLVSQQRRLQAAAADPAAECLAKVVYHEAANQELRGQLAVAQLVLNRVRHVAFPKSICAVVNQPGQFFETAEFTPPTDGRWRTALAIADIARREQLSSVVPGALFFHAAYAAPGWSNHRVRLAKIGDQVFYR